VGGINGRRLDEIGQGILLNYFGLSKLLCTLCSYVAVLSVGWKGTGWKWGSVRRVGTQRRHSIFSSDDERPLPR